MMSTPDSPRTTALRKIQEMAGRTSTAADGAKPAFFSTVPTTNLTHASQESIGVLRGGTVVTIQTRQAQMLVTGRERTDTQHRILGLMQFSKYLNQMADAARNDDPYADWFLLQAEEALEAASSGIASLRERLGKLLDSVPAMQVEVAQSTKPLRITLNFAASYAYWTTRVITDYDELVRMVLTARHVAYMDAAAERGVLNEASRMVRRVFESTARYRYTGITRAEVRQATEPARQAAELMGQLPVEILEKRQRPKFAPAITRTATGNKASADTDTDYDHDATPEDLLADMPDATATAGVAA
ncbi:PFL_4669 family integrating conjugative element protein [Thiothrix subterranea]|uniref:TIGR03761 family integrating conjugative element protein n=1 Tax=Thiothrix subterranea TaxID=2735563 RepID=A0AA51MME4_9GAMM|nr:TIGR03761 family integrating conjugative element protein [Thiothrix subterranea]MDQ5767962.1 TIGR03761 family integrating conjugative element protein [Thiothrix subterranea]WML86580.1 TIGR03761 family integrating conjugative element protein [Thiothrix subterranea]